MIARAHSLPSLEWAIPQSAILPTSVQKSPAPELNRSKLMNLRMETVGMESATPVFELVLTLLRELGEEADDLGHFDEARVRAAWQKASDRVHILLARTEGNQIVGIATTTESFAIYANGLYGIINEMYVSPDYRSRGVGKDLIDGIKRLARTRGWSRIDVVCPESDRWVRTRRFYEREGFTFAGPKLKFMV